MARPYNRKPKPEPTPPAQGYQVETDAYMLAIAYKPVIAVEPKVNLTDAQKDVLAEILFALSDIEGLPVERLKATLDHWFVGLGKPSNHPRRQVVSDDLDTVVLIQGNKGK